MNKIRVKTILSLVGMFILGAIAGWFQGRHYPFSNIFRPTNTVALQEHISNRLKSRLELNKEQIEKIRPIVNEAAKEIVQNQNEMLDRVNLILAKRDEQISPLLDLQQQKKLEAMQQRRKKFLEHVH